MVSVAKRTAIFEIYMHKNKLMVGQKIVTMWTRRDLSNKYYLRIRLKKTKLFKKVIQKSHGRLIRKNIR